MGKKITYLCACVIAAVSNASYGVQGNAGKVVFKGEIIESPCSISTASQDQTVDFGGVSTKSLEKGKSTEPKLFSIKLDDCSVDTGKTVAITFNGKESSDPANKGRLELNGSAKGASVGINYGEASVQLGKPVNIGLNNGSNSLDFSAYLKGDSVSKDGTTAPSPKEIIPGTFQTVANFMLEYK